LASSIWPRLTSLPDDAVVVC